MRTVQRTPVPCDRHVAGEARSFILGLAGKRERIGVSSEKHLARALSKPTIPGRPGRDVYVNFDLPLSLVETH